MARWDQIQLCLESLRRQTYPPAKVIVVVDGNAELAAALRGTVIDEVIVELAVNSGLSVARNAGIEQVETPWVAFLDDDAIADPTWLERLAAARDETHATGVGGWVEPLFEEQRPAWFPSQLLWTVGCSHAGLPEERAFVRNVFGGCALMSTAALRDEGGYDPQFGRRGDSAEGGEEAELCLRIARRDPSATFVLEPSAVIHHHIPRERATVRYVLRRCHVEGGAKSRLARRQGTKAVSNETSFARQSLTDAARMVSSGRPGQAVVLLTGVGLAGVGFAADRVQAMTRDGAERARAQARRDTPPTGQRSRSEVMS